MRFKVCYRVVVLEITLNENYGGKRKGKEKEKGEGNIALMVKIINSYLMTEVLRSI